MPSHTTYFTFCFTSSKCFCHLAVRKHWTKVLRFAFTGAKWILCYDDFKDPHYLSFFLSLFRAAAWSVFCLSCCKCCFQCWIVVCKTLLMFQSISMCVQDFFYLTCTWKWFWAEFVLCWVNVSIFFEAKVYINQQLTIYPGKMFYTLSWHLNAISKILW